MWFGTTAASRGGAVTVEVARSPGGGIVVVAPVGELDLASAPALREALQGAWDSGETLVVLDLRQVTFADITAIGVFAAAGQRLRRARAFVAARQRARRCTSSPTSDRSGVGARRARTWTGS
jgi:anti-sigma B factor antagonist